jgi:hypothetical protein
MISESEWLTRKKRIDSQLKELQSALAEAGQTNKRTAGVFLDTLSNLASNDFKGNRNLKRCFEQPNIEISR